MKLLVFAHRLELGGTQVNAIELASVLRDRHDFDVVFHAAPGPLEALVREKGLRYVPAPDVRLHPSPARIRALRALVRQERPALIHAWDWWQGLEAYCGVHYPQGVPLVISDMMMSLTRVLPRQVPTTFGFAALARQAKRAGFRRTAVLAPPVDVQANAPGAVEADGFRRRAGLRAGEIVVVSVSRLSDYMKSEPLVRAIEVMREVGQRLPLRLCIAGDGEARPRLQRLADETNRALGRDAVVLVGPMIDPRPAYEAADIMLGMGGSALRGLAFGKPLVVVGEAGMAKTFTPRSAPEFLDGGMYGRGDGSPDNRSLAQALGQLGADADLRAGLGQFGRDFVVRNHGLEAMGERLAAFCREAAEPAAARRPAALDAARTAYFYLRERRFLVPSRDVVAGQRT